MNGIFEFDQAKALADLGHRVTYGALDLRSLRKKRSWGFEQKQHRGVTVIALNLPVGNIGKNLTQKVRITALEKLYKKMVTERGKPDVVHAQFINVGHAATKVLKNRDFPLVYTEHYSGLNQEVLDPRLQKLGEETYREVDQFLAVSQYLAENLNRHFGIRPRVIPNIVDTGRFQYDPHKKKTPPSEFHFISVGSLQKHKEHHLLIEAFFEAFSREKGGEEHPLAPKGVKLYIYGGGPEREALQTLITEKNLETQVFLMGQQPRETIAEKMQQSQAFVLASKLETFGVAFIEAMAAGLPVISLAKGGPQGFITEKNGILVPGGDREDLKQAMIRMVQRIDQYDPSTLSQEMKEIFSPKKIAEALVDVYNEGIKN
nr:glycosyltransferase [Isachenkonia alkalipeptolytica]